MNSLSTDQQHTLDAILTWFKQEKKDRQFITMGGYAGTGKTSGIAIIREEMGNFYTCF